MLKKYRISETASICRFERSVGDEMFRFTVRREEADALLQFIRLLYANNTESYIPKLSYTLDKYSNIDFVGLLQCQGCKRHEELFIGDGFPHCRTAYER